MVYEFFDKKSALLIDKFTSGTGVNNEMKQNKHWLKNYTNPLLEN